MTKITNVLAAYISPAGTTKKVTRAIASGVARSLRAELHDFDWTLEKDREWEVAFEGNDLLVIGMPTYGGRLPNLLMPYVRDNLLGEATYVLPVVTYGGRAYDGALQELSSILTTNGFVPFAAATVPCEHSFAPALQTGRPTAEDLAAAKKFGERAGENLLALLASDKAVPTTGDAGSDAHAAKARLDAFAKEVLHTDKPIPGYYQPLREDGEPANMLPSKPTVDAAKCIGCGNCSVVCPLSSIEMGTNALAAKGPKGMPNFTGICVKCMACFRACPADALRLLDEDFISHKNVLEKTYGDAVCEAEYLLP